MTSDPRAKKIMVPWEIQASAVFNAVMGVFPLLEMKPAETEHLLRWVARRDRATLRAVRAKETRQRIPEGPGGYWSRWYQRSGKAYRPHRLDEVFVEWMSSVWIEENEPGYLMVISSGPFGGLCAVFWNDSLISEEEYMPFQTLEEAKTWVKRRLESPCGFPHGEQYRGDERCGWW